MVSSIFVEISLLIILVGLVSLLMRAISQPLIIGYILTGILVSPIALNLMSSQETLETLSQIGIAFLLFIVGLHLNPGVIRSVGRTAFIAALLQIILTFMGAYFLAFFLGFAFFEALIIGAALTFSSTIIVLKILSDKREIDSVYGKISITILILQDLAVFFLLLLLPAFVQNVSLPLVILNTVVKGLVILGILFILTRYFFPRLASFVSRSSELLFVFSLGWCFAIALLFALFGFNIELGALFAGVALSMSPYHHEISSRIRPLRDFFLIVFFVLLGSYINISSLTANIMPVLLFSLFVLLVKPLIIMTILAILGHRKRNNFMTGISLAQVSEFSFLLVTFAVGMQYFTARGNDLITVITVVGLITIAGSTYFMSFSETIYSFFSPVLRFFERDARKRSPQEESIAHKKYEVVILGSNRIGFSIVQAFRHRKKNALVVDFDPDVVHNLSAQGVDVMYGDAEDIETLSDIDFRTAKMVISTVPNLHSNLLLINLVKHCNSRAITIIVSQNVEEARTLYKEGASYVLMPHFLGGYHVAALIQSLGINYAKFVEEGKKHLSDLDAREKFWEQQK